MTSLGISTLAPETLDQIFDLLTPNDLTSCALVCRRWSLLTTRPLWQKIKFAIHPDDNQFLESLQARRESISNFRWTKHLDVNFSFVGPRCKTPTLEDLSQTLENASLFLEAAKYLPSRLSSVSLRIESYGWEDWQTIPRSEFDVLTNLYPGLVRPFLSRQIDKFNITFAPSNPPGDLSFRPGVNHNVFAFKEMITDLTIYVSLLVKHSPPTMPRLKSLVIDNLGDTWIGAEDLQKWTNLSHLGITALEIRNHYIPQQMVLPQTLTSLSLKNFQAIGTRPLALAFYYLPNLEHLRLQNIHNFTWQPIAQNTRIICTKLRTLSVINVTPITCSICRDIALSCPDLESLELPQTLKSLFIDHFVEESQFTDVRYPRSQWDNLVLGLTRTPNHLFLYEGYTRWRDPNPSIVWRLSRVEVDDTASPGSCVTRKGKDWFSLLRLDGEAWSQRIARKKDGEDKYWLLELLMDDEDTDDDRDGEEEME